MNRPVAFIARETKTNHHSINVLLAALEKTLDADECCLDFANRTEQLIHKAREYHRSGRLSVIAWSFHTADCQQTFRELQQVKTALTDIASVHVAGGAHISAEPESAIERGFDFVIAGEGEEALPKLIHRLSQSPDIALLPRLIRAPLQPGVNLDAFPPFPEKMQKLNPIEITRGCIYACQFCQTAFLFGAQFRHRSVDQIAHYADLLVKRGGRFLRVITPSAFSYGSKNSEPCLDQVETLLRALRRVMGPDRKIYFGTFPSEIRPEHVTPESMRILKHYADNDNVIIGAQSGSEKILRACHRQANPEQVIYATECAIRFGFRVNVDFIFGLPGEDETDRLDTLSLIRRLTDMGARIHAHWFIPIPGTPFAQEPVSHPDPLLWKKIHALMSDGKLYGQWSKQLQIVNALPQRQ